MSTSPASPSEPSPDCDLCPRLEIFRQQNRAAYPDFFNAPVPSFGPVDARMLIVGLAPGLKGANRTARPFTGDYAGDLLYPTLLSYGFAKGRYGASPDDGLTLVDCRITNAVRCVPPQNKPVGAEVTACRGFLRATMDEMPNLRVLLVLGGLAHGATLAALGERKSAYKFRHGGVETLPQGSNRPGGGSGSGSGPGGSGPVGSASGAEFLLSSYHCSRYNTNTGRLTEAMFHDVFAKARALLD